MERCRRIFLCDWVYGSERVEQQAMIVGQATTLFEPGQPELQLGRALASGREELLSAARRYLDPERSGVVGWSRAEPSSGSGP